MKRHIIQTLLVEPGRNPVCAYLPLKRAAMEQAIGINASSVGVARVKEIDPGIYILYQDEGIPLELEGNRRVGSQIITGTFYVIAADGRGNIGSLSNYDLQKYQERFWEPETFTYEEMLQGCLETSLRALDELEFCQKINTYY